jgi:hypothetical protein
MSSENYRKILHMKVFNRDSKYKITSKYEKSKDGLFVSWEGVFAHFSTYYGEFDSDYEEYPVFFTSDGKEKCASFENDIFYFIENVN